MSDLVLDCSVVMSWCFQDEKSAYADLVLEYLESADAYVPFLWNLEVANVLALAEQKKRISPAQAHQFLELLHQLPILQDSQMPRLIETWQHSRQHKLTAYDALYLELASRRQLPLATQDQALKKAATHYGLIVFSA